MFTKRAFVLTVVAVAALVISLVGPAMAVTAAKPTPPPPTPTPGAPTPIQIYGAWHCGNDACLWANVRTVAEFDSMNHWLIDRGDGSGRPSVNIVVLSFVNPLKLLNKTNDAGTVNGVPRGMTPDIVNYFKSRGIRVMLSIGGITFVNDWNSALATTATATQFGLNAAEVAQNLGVGIEIDYEENNSPRLPQLQAFIDAYRSVLPYDSTGNNHAARLTIDLGAGNRWLVPLNQKASADWLKPSNPVLDYANAMVAARPDSDPATVTGRWNEHITGYLQTVPLAPAKLTGSLWLQHRTTLPECVDFANSLQKSTGPYVQTVAPAGTGTTTGMLGFMFWAAEVEGTRTITTQPPNTCENGMGGAANFYNIPIPMPALRQQ